MRLPAAFALVLLLSVEVGAQDFSNRIDYSGHRVVRVLLEEPSDIDTMRAIAPDFWAEGLALGPMDFRVPPERMADLDATGLAYLVTVPDLAPLIAAEEQSILLTNSLRGLDWFTDFKTLAQINTRLDELVALRPDLVSKFTIGTSIQGRPIHGLRIADDSAGDPNRPALLFNGTQHAREWASPMTVMYIADQLIENEASDGRVAALLDHLTLYIIPVINPDGYEYTWTSERLWRKNRRNNGNGTFGVDLNRNWGTGWGGPGASGNTSDPTYYGTAAFSEPESAALRDFFIAHADIRAHVDFHSYSQLVLRPWGYIDAEPGGQGGAVLTALGDDMAATIFSVSGESYVSQPAHDLYIASGTVPDWAWEQRGVYSWTIELRPETSNPGFLLPASEIIPTGAENYAAVLRLAEQIALGLQVTAGELPDVVAPDTAAPVSVEVVELDATLAQATLNARVGASGAFTPTPMAAAAGSTYVADLPGAPCGEVIQYYFAFTTTDGRSATAPIDAPNTLFSATALEQDEAFADDMEAAGGWTVGAPGDSASTGVWTRGNPNGTPAQPEDDHTPGGTDCWFTGQGAPGGAIGTADVDGGATTLISPLIDLSAAPEAALSYWRWYSNDQGSAPNADVFTVDISDDGGSSWTNVEVVGPGGPGTSGGWIQHSFRVADLVTPTAQVRLRFIAEDAGSGSIVEAAIDDLRAVTTGCADTCPGDANGDGTIGLDDLLLTLAAFGTCSDDPGYLAAADADLSGCIDLNDLLLLLSSFGGTCA